VTSTTEASGGSALAPTTTDTVAAPTGTDATIPASDPSETAAASTTTTRPVSPDSAIQATVGVPEINLHPPVQISTSPTSGVTDGTPITVHVAAQPGNAIFSVTAKLCRGDKPVSNTAEFLTSAGLCAPKPLSANSDNEVQEVSPPPNSNVDLTFRVGVGTATWSTGKGGDATQTCGPGQPCKLVLELEVMNQTAFYPLPITFS
jgi:hypothetical protein